MSHKLRDTQSGFSLIELLFAMVIFLVVLAAISSAFISPYQFHLNCS